MAVTLWDLGEKQSKTIYRNALKVERQASQVLKDLRVSLRGRLFVLVDKLYPFDDTIMSFEYWRRNKVSMLNGMASDIRRGYEKLAKLAEKTQKSEFFRVTKELQDAVKQMLPTKVEISTAPLKKLDFTKAKMALDVDTGQMKRMESLFEGKEIDYDLAMAIVRSDSGFGYLCSPEGGEERERWLREWLEKQEGVDEEEAEELGEEEEERVIGGGDDYRSGDQRNSDMDVLGSVTVAHEEILTEAKKRVALKVGDAKVSGDFQKFLRDQLDTDLFPGNKIRTLSQDHIKFVQGVMMGGIQKGKDLQWQRKFIINKIGKDISSAKAYRTLEYNTMRVLRTSHQRAANAATSHFSQRNRHLIGGLIRHANGRPCVACVFLDGSQYPVGASMDDHINGMCVLILRLKSLEEMGMSFNDLPDRAKRVWKGAQVKQYQTIASRFHQLPAAQQAKIFANKKLFQLWQREKFSIEKMIVSKNGMQLPMTYTQALVNLEKMGAVSHPNIGIAYKTGLKKPGVPLTAKDKELVGIMDPKDRLNGGAVAMRDIDPDLLVDMKSKHGQSLFGMGDDVRDVVAPDVLEDALAQLHGVSPGDAFWYDFNEYARRLGLARRKATDGSWYFVPAKGKVDDVVRRLA